MRLIQRAVALVNAIISAVGAERVDKLGGFKFRFNSIFFLSPAAVFDFNVL
jgi:hypothetical protein